MLGCTLSLTSFNSSFWMYTLPCLKPFLPAEALTGMQKLCSSLCSNSVGSRNNDSRPTSPFRHHFLPHSQGKSPIQPSSCPTEAAHHPHPHLELHFQSLILYVILDPGPLLIRFVIIDLNPVNQDSASSLPNTIELFDLIDSLNKEISVFLQRTYT